MSPVTAKFFLFLIWTAWCFVHSFLISRPVMDRMKKLLGNSYGYYRLAYNTFSLLSLMPVIYFQLSLAEKNVFTWPWPWPLLKYGMYATSLFLFYGGFKVYNIQYMLGIKQVKRQNQEGNDDFVEFTSRGILGYVRHPWYSGAILFVWAFDNITDVTLISKMVLSAYIIIGTRLEEKKLIAEIGAPYLDYRKKVPMLIPWKKAN